MPFQVQTTDLRMNYKTCMAMLQAANPGEKIDDKEVTQGYIRTEATLKVSSNVIQFPVIDTQQVANAPLTPTMKLLTMQDSFVIGSMSYFLQLYQYTDGSQQNPDFASGRNWAPVTYPSPYSNNNNDQLDGFTGLEWDPGCQLFWLGYLSLEVDKHVLIPQWDTYRHYKAPRTQATFGLQPVSPTIQPYSYTPNQWNDHDGSSDGFYPVEPNLVIGGGRGNILRLNLPANIPSTIAPFTRGGYGTTYVAKAVIVFRGILAQNSTNVH